MSGHDHDHPHSHPHGDHHHGHGHGHSVGIIDGPVVLDIGDGFGALIVTMADQAEGTELHARTEGQPGTIHTGVWRRTNGDRTTVMAVFAELRAGRWTLLRDDGSAWRDIVVHDGAVASLDLR